MTKVIMIHGRDQQNEEENALKQLWIDTLKKGLAKSNLTLPEDTVFEFPYYGKLLYKLVEEAKNAPKDTQSRGLEPVLGEMGAIGEAGEIGDDFLKDFLMEVGENADMTDAEKQELKGINEVQERGLMNSELLQNLLEFFDKKGIFGDLTIKKFTLDVFLYLTQSAIRTQINKVVEDKFTTEPCVLVGHSMGTIVAYLVLKNNPQYNIKKIITVGSPLGLKSIQKYLDLPLLKPECLKGTWYNAYDEADVVALNPLSKKFFSIAFDIINNGKIKNQTENRHGITGYLDDAVVAKEIYEALI